MQVMLSRSMTEVNAERLCTANASADQPFSPVIPELNSLIVMSDRSQMNLSFVVNLRQKAKSGRLYKCCIEQPPRRRYRSNLGCCDGCGRGGQGERIPGCLRAQGAG